MGSKQLSNLERPSPEGPGPQTESGTVQPSQESLETKLLLTILVVNLWVCILLVFRTRDRIFRLREQRVEKHKSEVQE